MTKEKLIAFIGAQELMLDLYQPALDERHTLYPDTPHYRLIKSTDAQNESFVMLNYSSDTAAPFIAQLLASNPELRLLVLTSVGNPSIVNELKQLALNYPLAVVDVAYQPFQPSRVWEFLDKSESKQIHYDWEEGDWDEL